MALGADSTSVWAAKGLDREATWRDRVTTWLAAERVRFVVWSPVFLVLGIWLYFSLVSEPTALLLGALGVGAVALLRPARRNLLLALLVVVMAGFVLAGLRTTLVHAPPLRSVELGQQVTAHIVDISQRGKARAIWVAEIASWEGALLKDKPQRLRVTVNKPPKDVRIGDLIALTVDVRPLPRPVKPGAFDYARQLYFEGIGGMGQARTVRLQEQGAVPWRFKLRRAMHGLRAEITAKITEAIPGPIGAFAAAIISGERAQIPKAMNDSLISSGLSHILSISGLHMTLVAGGVFWLVRALFALSPRLALNYPIKKWAAVAALVAGLFYMLLADSGSATERSYMMIAIVFFAVIVGRPALSMHNLAIAALIILILSPEQALAASFQMSFLAVMGLAAFFEYWQRWQVNEYKEVKEKAWLRYAKSAFLVAVASIFTSIIAGGLSSIAALHHFGRVAPYGVLANALALPIVSVVVMPAALVATLAMPFGLSHWPLQILEKGLQAVMWVSDFVASLPGASQAIAQWPALTAALAALAAALFFIAGSRLRWLAVVPTVAAVVLHWDQLREDIIIEEQGRNVAVRLETGKLALMDGRKSGFAAKRWLGSDGDVAAPKDAALRQAWDCTKLQCVVTVKGKRVVVLLREAEVFTPCPAADILIAQYPLRKRCKGHLATIDRFDLWRNGAQNLRIAETRIEIQTAKGLQGERPWAYVSEPRKKRLFADRP
jgi:competence protein ComEC